MEQMTSPVVGLMVLEGQLGNRCAAKSPRGRSAGAGASQAGIAQDGPQPLGPDPGKRNTST